MREIYLSHRESLTKEIDVLSEKIRALDVLIGDTTRVVVKSKRTGALIEEILEVLSEVEESTASDIASKISFNRGVSDVVKQKSIKTSVTIYCSRLLKKGKIGARSIGKTYLYNIKPNKQ